MLWLSVNANTDNWYEHNWKKYYDSMWTWVDSDAWWTDNDKWKGWLSPDKFYRADLDPNCWAWKTCVNLNWIIDSDLFWEFSFSGLTFSRLELNSTYLQPWKVLYNCKKPYSLKDPTSLVNSKYWWDLSFDGGVFWYYCEWVWVLFKLKSDSLWLKYVGNLSWTWLTDTQKLIQENVMVSAREYQNIYIQWTVSNSVWKDAVYWWVKSWIQWSSLNMEWANAKRATINDTVISTGTYNNYTNKPVIYTNKNNVDITASTVMNWVNVVIVKWWDVTIKSNITKKWKENSAQMVIIAMNDESDAKKWWNIYIDWSVTNIDAVLIAEKSLLNSDLLNKSNQLYIYWSVFSKNTIGKSEIPVWTSDYMNWIRTTWATQAQKDRYNLARLRDFKTTDDTLSWTTIAEWTSKFAWNAKKLATKKSSMVNWNYVLDTDTSRDSLRNISVKDWFKALVASVYIQPDTNFQKLVPELTWMK